MEGMVHLLRLEDMVLGMDLDSHVLDMAPMLYMVGAVLDLVMAMDLHTVLDLLIVMDLHMADTDLLLLVGLHTYPVLMNMGLLMPDLDRLPNVAVMVNYIDSFVTA